MQDSDSTPYEKYSIADQEKVTMDVHYLFTLEGFADHPMMYINPTIKGLEFDYEGIEWHGEIPDPHFYKKHLLNWRDLENLTREEQQKKILDLFMKTFNTRQRQYRKCQFCGRKVAGEHRYDKNTCHGCATEHFGVVY